MIFHICDNASVLGVMRIVKIVITIIKIAVPVFLLVTGALDYLRTMKDKDVDLGKTNKLFIKKCIAAIIIFLIPTFVRIVVKISSGDEGYYKCFNNASVEKIDDSLVTEAKTYLQTLAATYNESDYNVAYLNIMKINDESKKNQMLSELSGYKKGVEEKNKISVLQSNYSDEKYAELEEEINALPDSPIKDELLERLENVKEVIGLSTKYTKEQIIAMDEATVKNMSNQEFIEFAASAAQIVYAEIGGVLPSITIAQGILESGYGDHFENTSHNLYGLIGYPGSKPKVNRTRKFDNFYESTYYHATYFTTYSNVYGSFLKDCENKDAIHAASYLGAYAGGSTSYGPTIQQLINQYNLTQYDN